MSNKSKILIFILLIVIILIIALSIYFLVFSKNKQQVPAENQSQNNSLLTNEVENENKIENTTNVANTTNTSSTSQNTSVTKVDISEDTNSTKSETIANSSEANIDELKKLLETYSVGIQRITYGGENLESNTVLLFLAKQYFDGSANKKSSLKIDTTYASTVKNIHKYLTELIGTNYNNVQSINSFKNYVGYSSATNSYEYGADISTLKDEQYECPKLELTKEKNGIYTAKGEVIRIANNEETVYDITLNFQINQNYTYQKYQIVSLKSANKSFYPDNTVHLVENTEVEEGKVRK